MCIDIWHCNLKISGKSDLYIFQLNSQFVMNVAVSKMQHKHGMSVFGMMVLYCYKRLMLWKGTWCGKMHRLSGLAFFFNGLIIRRQVKIDGLFSYFLKLHMHCNHYSYSNVKEKRHLFKQIWKGFCILMLQS